MKTFARTFLAVVILIWAVLANAGERPPQYVLFSFDGSYNLSVWKKIRAFAQEQRNKHHDVRFTFFASGVYFLSEANETLYQAPGHSAGKSDIGFGDDSDDIALRIDQVNLAYKEGHEIGSHANGHYDGGEWTYEQWTSEFKQFEKLIFNVFSIESIDPQREIANGWLMKKSDIKGYRAPLLSTNQGMYKSLKDFGFTYDCSQTDSTDYWPAKSSLGIWNFPLAELKIAGTGKKTLSMDYNFYVSQSNGEPDTDNKELYSQQMYDTYIAWFSKNYSGSRAPINIGHHFSAWNDGAYYEAMTNFAEVVCGLPEVKCVTYTEYVKWLEGLSPQVLAGFKAGQFTKANPVQLGAVAAPLMLDVEVELRSTDEGAKILAARLDTKEKIQGLRLALSVNGHSVDASQISLSEIQSLGFGNQVSVTAHAMDKNGIELARSTQILHGLLTSQPALSMEPAELRALKGDLAEAHKDERK